jgi:WD40 repeat protein
VAFSPDGLTALTGSWDNTARLWDVKTGQLRLAALKHEFVVAAVAFSPDGLTALTGSWDKTARLWDVYTGLPVGPPFRHEGAVNAVAFSPDGLATITGSSDRTARLWLLPGKADGPPEYLRLRFEVMTWLTMDEQGGMRRLRADEWKRKQEELKAHRPPGSQVPSEDSPASAGPPSNRRLREG